MLKKLLSLLISSTLLWTSGNAAQAAALAPEIFASPSNLPQFQLAPPIKLGRIVDYYDGAVGREGDGAKKLVVLIQDLHAHYGVQKNIAGLLEFLSQKLRASPSPLAGEGGRSPDEGTPHPPYGHLLPQGEKEQHVIPFALAVEGASGPIDSSVMALFPDKKSRLTASDYLMREGELSGAEYFAVNRGLPRSLVGIENEEYYQVHRDLFRKTLPTREALVSILKNLDEGVRKLPSHLYHGSTWQIHKQLKAYDDAQLSLGEFIRGLDIASRSYGLDIKKQFPELAAFADGTRLSSDALRRQTAQFLTDVQGTLSAQERKNLALLAKQRSTAPYYLYIRDLVYAHQLFLTIPADLARYLEFIHTAQGTGVDRVTFQARELAYRLKERAAQTQEEKDLALLEHDLSLLLRLADLQATEAEVKAFGPRLNQFIALAKQLIAASGGRPFDEKQLRQLLLSSIDFYALALMRNEPMIDNTLALIEETPNGGRQERRLTETAADRNGGDRNSFKKATTRRPSRQPNLPSAAVSVSRPSTAVLVAGGFHTLFLTDLLRKKNVSYIVISPSVDSVTPHDHDLYVKRLMGEALTDAEILDGINRPAAGRLSIAALFGKKDHASLAYIFDRVIVFKHFLLGAQALAAAAAPSPFRWNRFKRATAAGLLSVMSAAQAGPVLPGTQFRLGADNDEAAIQSLRNSPDYGKWVAELRRVKWLRPNQDFVEVLLENRNALRRLNLSPKQLADWISAANANSRGTEINGQIITQEGLRGGLESLYGFPKHYTYLVARGVLMNGRTGFRLSRPFIVDSDFIRDWAFIGQGSVEELATVFTGLTATPPADDRFTVHAYAFRNGDSVQISAASVQYRTQDGRSFRFKAAGLEFESDPADLDAEDAQAISTSLKSLLRELTPTARDLAQRLTAYLDAQNLLGTIGLSGGLTLRFSSKLIEFRTRDQRTFRFKPIPEGFEAESDTGKISAEDARVLQKGLNDFLRGRFADQVSPKIKKMMQDLIKELQDVITPPPPAARPPAAGAVRASLVILKDKSGAMHTPGPRDGHAAVNRPAIQPPSLAELKASGRRSVVVGETGSGHRIEAYTFDADLGPGEAARYFPTAEKNVYIIALNKRLPERLLTEVLKGHEGYEFYWLAQGISEEQAHRITSAHLLVDNQFSKKGEIPESLRWALFDMSEEDLDDIIREYETPGVRDAIRRSVLEAPYSSHSPLVVYGSNYIYTKNLHDFSDAIKAKERLFYEYAKLIRRMKPAFAPLRPLAGEDPEALLYLFEQYLKAAESVLHDFAALAEKANLPAASLKNPVHFFVSKAHVANVDPGILEEVIGAISPKLIQPVDANSRREIAELGWEAHDTAKVLLQPARTMLEDEISREEAARPQATLTILEDDALGNVERKILLKPLHLAATKKGLEAIIRFYTVLQHSDHPDNWQGTTPFGRAWREVDGVPEFAIKDRGYKIEEITFRKLLAAIASPALLDAQGPASKAEVERIIHLAKQGLARIPNIERAINTRLDAEQSRYWSERRAKERAEHQRAEDEAVAKSPRILRDHVRSLMNAPGELPPNVRETGYWIETVRKAGGRFDTVEREANIYRLIARAGQSPADFKLRAQPVLDALDILERRYEPADAEQTAAAVSRLIDAKLTLLAFDFELPENIAPRYFNSSFWHDFLSPYSFKHLTPIHELYNKMTHAAQKAASGRNVNRMAPKDYAKVVRPILEEYAKPKSQERQGTQATVRISAAFAGTKDAITLTIDRSNDLVEMKRHIVIALRKMGHRELADNIRDLTNELGVKIGDKPQQVDLMNDRALRQIDANQVTDIWIGGIAGGNGRDITPQAKSEAEQKADKTVADAWMMINKELQRVPTNASLIGNDRFVTSSFWSTLLGKEGLFKTGPESWNFDRDLFDKRVAGTLLAVFYLANQRYPMDRFPAEFINSVIGLINEVAAIQAGAKPSEGGISGIHILGIAENNQLLALTVPLAYEEVGPSMSSREYPVGYPKFHVLALDTLSGDRREGTFEVPLGNDVMVSKALGAIQQGINGQPLQSIKQSFPDSPNDRGFRHDVVLDIMLGNGKNVRIAREYRSEPSVWDRMAHEYRLRIQAESPSNAVRSPLVTAFNSDEYVPYLSRPAEKSRPLSVFGNEISWGPIWTALAVIREFDQVAWKGILGALDKLSKETSILRILRLDAIRDAAKEATAKLAGAATIEAVADAIDSTLLGSMEATRILLDAVAPLLGFTVHDRLWQGLQYMGPEVSQAMEAAEVNFQRITSALVYQRFLRDEKSNGGNRAAGSLDRLIFLAHNEHGVLSVTWHTAAIEKIRREVDRTHGNLESAFLAVLLHEYMRAAEPESPEYFTDAELESMKLDDKDIPLWSHLSSREIADEFYWMTTPFEEKERRIQEVYQRMEARALGIHPFLGIGTPEWKAAASRHFVDRNPDLRGLIRHHHLWDVVEQHGAESLVDMYWLPGFELQQNRDRAIEEMKTIAGEHFTEWWPTFHKLAMAADAHALDILTWSLAWMGPNHADLIHSEKELEQVGSELVRIAQTAGPKAASDVLVRGLIFMSPKIHSLADLARIGNDLAQIGKAAEESSNLDFLYHDGLLNLFQLYRESFDGMWPHLVRLLVTARKEAPRMASQYLPALGALMASEKKNYWVTRLTNSIRLGQPSFFVDWQDSSAKVSGRDKIAFGPAISMGNGSLGPNFKSMSQIADEDVRSNSHLQLFVARLAADYLQWGVPVGDIVDAINASSDRAATLRRLDEDFGISSRNPDALKVRWHQKETLTDQDIIDLFNTDDGPLGRCLSVSSMTDEKLQRLIQLLHQAPLHTEALKTAELRKQADQQHRSWTPTPGHFETAGALAWKYERDALVDPAIAAMFPKSDQFPGSRVRPAAPAGPTAIKKTEPFTFLPNTREEMARTQQMADRGSSILQHRYPAIEAAPVPQRVTIPLEDHETDTMLQHFNYSAISADGSVAVIIRNPKHESHYLDIVDVRNGRVVSTMPFKRSITNPTFSPDGRTLAFAMSNEIDNTLSNVHLLDLSAPAKPKRLVEFKNKNFGQHEISIHQMIFIPSLNQQPGALSLAIAGDEGRIQIVDVSDLKNLYRSYAFKELGKHTGGQPWSFTSLAASPDGKTLVVGGQGGEFFVGRLTPAGRHLEVTWQHHRRVHNAVIGASAISPDGRWLVTGDNNGIVKLWDLNGAAHTSEMQWVPANIGMVQALEFKTGKDGAVYLILSGMNRAEIYDMGSIKNPQLLFSEQTEQSLIHASLSPEDSLILAGRESVTAIPAVESTRRPVAKTAYDGKPILVKVSETPIVTIGTLGDLLATGHADILKQVVNPTAAFYVTDGTQVFPLSVGESIVMGNENNNFGSRYYLTHPRQARITRTGAKTFEIEDLSLNRSTTIEIAATPASASIGDWLRSIDTAFDMKYKPTNGETSSEAPLTEQEFRMALRNLPVMFSVRGAQWLATNISGKDARGGKFFQWAWYQVRRVAATFEGVMALGLGILASFGAYGLLQHLHTPGAALQLITFTVGAVTAFLATKSGFWAIHSIFNPKALEGEGIHPMMEDSAVMAAMTSAATGAALFGLPALTIGFGAVALVMAGIVWIKHDRLNEFQTYSLPNGLRNQTILHAVLARLSQIAHWLLSLVKGNGNVHWAQTALHSMGNVRLAYAGAPASDSGEFSEYLPAPRGKTPFFAKLRWFRQEISDGITQTAVNTAA